MYIDLVDLVIFLVGECQAKNEPHLPIHGIVLIVFIRSILIPILVQLAILRHKTHILTSRHPPLPTPVSDLPIPFPCS